MKRQTQNIVIGFLVCAVAILFVSYVVSSLHNNRSTLGRISRWLKGESTIDQCANDLSEDIQTKPEFRNLQPWALEILARCQKGQLQTNRESTFWRADKAVTLAPSERPKFINDNWTFNHKGWVLPDISVVFSNQTPVCIVVDFSGYGVAVGPPEYHLTFDADKTNQVLPGIYTYLFYE